MLIIEGPDLCGKTTLCNALLKRLWENPKKYGNYPAVYEHFSRLPPSWRYPKSYLPFIKRYSVMDRFHLSELCYGRVTRGGTHLTANCVRFLDAQLALVGSYTVLITTSDDFLKAHWGRDEMFTLDQVLAVNKMYKSLAEYNPEAHVDISFTVESEDDFVAKDEDAMDKILLAWTGRLGYLMAVYGDVIQYAANPVNEIEVLRAKA
jgi:thymidylate kinase